jgi:hypothetical protein
MRIDFGTHHGLNSSGRATPARMALSGESTVRNRPRPAFRSSGYPVCLANELGWEAEIRAESGERSELIEA